MAVVFPYVTPVKLFLLQGREEDVAETEVKVDFMMNEKRGRLDQHFYQGPSLFLIWKFALPLAVLLHIYFLYI